MRRVSRPLRGARRRAREAPARPPRMKKKTKSLPLSRMNVSLSSWDPTCPAASRGRRRAPPVGLLLVRVLEELLGHGLGVDGCPTGIPSPRRPPPNLEPVCKQWTRRALFGRPVFSGYDHEARGIFYIVPAGSAAIDSNEKGSPTWHRGCSIQGARPGARRTPAES